MNKFHQIPTDQFVPISHDSSYLFTHYDKVANFLAFNLNSNYKSILAKPVQNGYVFDWFSIHRGLVNIKELSKVQADASLINYWKFIDIMNQKVMEFSNSKDEDKRNWASLLNKVFNHEDNFVFSNGQDISIVWGWKFDNNEIYKPSIVKKSLPDSEQGATPDMLPPVGNFQEPELIPPTNEGEEEEMKDFGGREAEKFEKKVDDLKINDPEAEEVLNNHSGFLEFLKWFAAKYWVLLWILTFLAAIVFFIKAYYLSY
jgi:hypothetical protein